MTTDDLIKQAKDWANWFDAQESGWCDNKAKLLRQLIVKVKEREGWVLVPVEPTAKMMNAFWLAGPYPAKPFINGYKAMIAASKEKP